MNINTTTIEGVIYKINNTERYTDFFKRTFWVQELNVKYPNTWQLEMWHDDTEILNEFSIHDIVQCEATLKGKLLEKRGSGEQFVINILKCDSIIKI